MKKLLLSILAITVSLCLFAAPRSQSEALSIAIDFFSQSANASTRSSVQPQLVLTSSDLSLDATRASSNQVDAFYIYNNGDNAFVIVSGDDRMRTILGYSNESAFIAKDMPVNLRSYLSFYVQELQEIEKYSSQVYKKQTTKSNYPSTVAPLLGNIKWNQSEPYNLLCPYDGGYQSPTGCVATAMAQIMKYYNYPDKGTGTHTYNLKSQNIDLSFDYENTSFQWNLMQSQYPSNGYSEEAGNAVATLMYGCGVAVEMMYAAGGSGAISVNVPNAMIEYFNYDENIVFLSRSCYLYDEWMDMIKKEISERRPIYYSGATSSNMGHAFVLDGYDASDLVHINWGWGGYSDGYFAVIEMNPNEAGIGGGNVSADNGYSRGQDMIIGIQKPTTSSVYTSRLECYGISIPSLSINAGDPFQPTIDRLYNAGNDFLGEVALVLEKDGNMIFIGDKTYHKPTLTKNFYYVNYNLNWSEVDPTLTFPTELEDGKYSFYAVSKDSSKEVNWNKVRSDLKSNALYTVVVSESGTKIDFIPQWGMNFISKLNANFIENQSVYYVGKTMNVNINMDNQSELTEYFDDIYIALLKNEKDTEPTIITSRRVVLKPGEKIESLKISEKLPSNVPAGNYKLQVLVDLSYLQYVSISNTVDITIKEYTEGVEDISFDNVYFTNSTICKGDPLIINATITATGTATGYDNRIGFLTFLDTGYSDEDFYHSIFVTKDEPYQLSHAIYPIAGEGNYRLGLYKIYNGNWTRHPQIYNFKIDNATGISISLADDLDKFIIYPQPVESTLYIRTEEEVIKVEVFDLSGKLQLTTNPKGTKGEYSIDVNQLTGGAYLLRMTTTNDVYIEKFIKK